MRVAIATNSLFRSDGIGSVAFDVGAGLVDAGHELFLAYPAREYDRPRLGDWTDVATGLVPVPELAIRGRDLLRTAVGTTTAVRTIRRLAPDVFYVHQPSHTALGAGVCLGRPTRQVLHLHGHPREPLGRSTRFGTRHCDVVVCVSESVRTAWDAHLSRRSETVVVHNGVDLERFRPASPEERAETRRRHRLPLSAPVVGFFGRCTREKGVVRLADAFLELSASLPQAWLIVAGTFPDEAVHREFTRKLNGLNVMLLGDLADPSEIMRSVDCAAVPSDMEAFPLVVLELLASGVPVVGSDVGGIREAVGPELAERLTPVGDVPGLARMMRHVLNSHSTGDAAGLARLRAETFALERSVNTTIALLCASVTR